MNERQLYTASYVKQIKGKSTALHIVLIFTQAHIFFKGLNICPFLFIALLCAYLKTIQPCIGTMKQFYPDF